MERLVKNIGHDIQSGDNGTLAVYDGPPGNERPTGEIVKAQNVGPYVFRSGKMGDVDEVRGELRCASYVV